MYFKKKNLLPCIYIFLLLVFYFMFIYLFVG